jgi:hypothetical protein
LCVYAKIKGVYAAVLSRKAQAALKENKIVHEWRELVDNVLDLNKTGICPFEKAAEDILDPREAYRIFRDLRENLKSCR